MRNHDLSGLVPKEAAWSFRVILINSKVNDIIILCSESF